MPHSVPAPRPAARQAKRRRPRRRPNPWNPLPPLLVGLCFGLAYAATGRLLEGRLSGLVKLGHRFEMKAVPGTTLESLRMRYGAAAVDLLAPAPQQPAPPPPPAVPSAKPITTAAAEATNPVELPFLEVPLPDPLEGLPPLPPSSQLPAPSATVGAPPPLRR